MIAIWNYRVIEYTDPNDGNVWYAIHEVHYDEDMTPFAYAEKHAAITWDEGESPSDVIAMISKALKHPPLKESDFTGER